LKKGFPRFPILDKKEIRVKFKEYIIVRGKVMNESNVLRGLWYMENMIELKISTRSSNNRFTNVLNVHT
jgi:hypothetical protein